ncbi:MAG: metal ABC transporter permease [Streptococcaceae bacterium]|jgi:zinc transport system permease protein|nr:metal ABC transporter permease [Streptococcaceae bacterium]
MSIFSYDFMQRALMASLLISLIAPMLGVFLVLRRQSLMADTLSHVSLFGVALGYFFGMNPTFSTMIVVLIAAVFLEILQQLYKTYSEISTAILMSGGLASALVMMSIGGGGKRSMSIENYLFGSIITISSEQVWMLLILLIIITVLYALFRRPMYVLTFDESTAYVDGLPTSLISILFNVITGVSIAIMIPIAGALLVSAIMILPAAIGMKVGRSFSSVILFSMISGLIGMNGGLLGSFFMETPPGASITLLFILLFILATGWKKILFILRKNDRKQQRV